MTTTIYPTHEKIGYRRGEEKAKKRGWALKTVEGVVTKGPSERKIKPPILVRKVHRRDC